jgi:hypothetical protein
MGVRSSRTPSRSAKPAALSLTPGRSASRFVELRAARDSDEPGHLVLATLRVQVPDMLWTGTFSRAHPNLRLEALNRTDVDEHFSVSDYWISGEPPGIWTNEISSYPDVRSAESLAAMGDGCLYRVTYRNPQIIYLYRRLNLPIQFPLRIQAGFMLWEVCARREDFQKVLDYARSAKRQFSIVSIRRQPLRSHLPVLTDAQHDLLTQAMAAGYFAVPRGITLTELARKLGRSKSGISESIAIIEKKLLESALRSAPAAA